MAEQPPIIAIMGPTATGKTLVAAVVARALGGEIISVDSMAVYRGMDVGTAKPDPEERGTVPFHLIDVADPDDPFNVARYKELADTELAAIRERGRRPIVAGGTGLYIRALLEGFGLTTTPPDKELRHELEIEAKVGGTARLHEKLRNLDPGAASKIHGNDKVRIIRALEVCIRTGSQISTQHVLDARRRRPLNAVKFGLTAGREELNRRIDARVDQMIARGLEGEVRNLIGRGYGPTLSMRSLGYKEISAYIAGEIDLPAAVQAIKQNTRRFAKRQLTWFRAEKDLTWIDVEGKTPPEIATEIIAQLPV